ncbi:hypothetical protein D9619_012036 [Psilocybe cf. subviscida]|uniref:non-specific serine/threonine protein kinase n=1 Tax=Psilocybe cf. subviscida TaxID=2480587 RepID=A0A8H5EZJ1_9AGAR|nr:hypothetical protein D9619_012036 [Psilocybe cf. subviscida]
MTDLKPENVLICIDDVESIISAELAQSITNSVDPSSINANPNLHNIATTGAQLTAPTRIVGVPPSKGRGGNQTPRSESILITGSQPLPSPSSSFGSSPMLDRWAFGMSKIDGDSKAPGHVKGVSSAGSGGSSDKDKSDKDKDLAKEVAGVSLDTRAGYVGRGGAGGAAAAGNGGPSLLSQLAPTGGSRPMPVPGKASGKTKFTVDPDEDNEDDEENAANGKSGSHMSVDRPQRGGRGKDSGSESGEESESEERSAYGVNGPGMEKITVKIADLGNGELRHINKLRYWPLESVLHDKYLFPKSDADALAAFLGPMLRLHPDKRAKAADLAQHVWLEGVVVQGEIDVIRRLELEDGRRRTEEQGRRLAREAKQEEEERRRSRSGGSGKGKAPENIESRREREALEQSERDAMKPVDESVLINGDDAEDEEDYDDQQQAPPHAPQQKVYAPPILNAAPQPPNAQKPADRSASGGGSGVARALNANAKQKQSPGKKANGSGSGRR